MKHLATVSYGMKTHDHMTAPRKINDMLVNKLN